MLYLNNLKICLISPVLYEKTGGKRKKKGLNKKEPKEPAVPLVQISDPF